MSVSLAFVFPILILGALWNLGLDGIWLNIPCSNVLVCILGLILLIRVLKEIKKKEAHSPASHSLSEE